MLLGALLLLGCERDGHPPGAATATKQPAPQEPQEPKEPQGLFGRWTGPHTCLELFPTGEFQISLLDEGPKVLILGTVTQHRLPDGAIRLELHASRIERSRWVSKCRKEVESERLLDAQVVVGTEITTAAPVTLTLAVKPNDQVELCGAECELLEKQTPLLLGDWRKAGIRSFADPGTSWTSGEVLQLGVHGDTLNLWVGGEGGEAYSAYGKLTQTSLAPGRFRIEVTVTLISATSTPGVNPDEIPALGAALHKDAARTLEVTRVAGGVEVCGEAGNCSKLPRFSML